MRHEAWGMRHEAWGMRHEAWGMRHGPSLNITIITTDEGVVILIVFGVVTVHRQRCVRRPTSDYYYYYYDCYCYCYCYFVVGVLLFSPCPSFLVLSRGCCCCCCCCSLVTNTLLITVALWYHHVSLYLLPMMNILSLFLCLLLFSTSVQPLPPFDLFLWSCLFTAIIATAVDDDEYISLLLHYDIIS